MPRNPASVLPASPFRLQLSLADVMEHRTWRHARVVALDALERGESVAVLGPSGTGKTLLLRSIGQALEGLGWTVATAGGGVWPDNAAQAGVLLVDEAASLSAQALAKLGALPCPFVLAALPGFAPHLSGLARPIAWVTLGPLSAKEVARVVAARMRAAGRDRDVFEAAALQALAHHSGGRLRLVLVLAGAALFLADDEGVARVTAGHVAEAAAMRAGPGEPAEHVPPTPAEQPGNGPAARGAEMRVRLDGARPVRPAGPRASQSGTWLRRTTVALVAAGLALAALAAVVMPRLGQAPTPRVEAPQTMAVVPPATQPVVPAVPAPEDIAAAEPTPPAPEQALPAPPPAPPLAPPPVARRAPAVARPAPRADATDAAPVPPRAQLPPLVEEASPVPPSPWWVERSTPPAATQATPERRIVTREPANIRGQPSIASPVVRITSAGMVLRVFAQRGPWLQVGDSGAWGWVHSAVVQLVP